MEFDPQAYLAKKKSGGFDPAAYLEKKKQQMKVINEDAPGIPFGDRFIAKNFAKDLDAQAKYLAKEHPEMDVMVKDGDVLLKKKSDNEWRKLDADGINSVRDLTDIAHVVPGALADIAGGALGGAGGLVAGGPAGAVAGGIAGSGAGGAAWEALRQKLGQKLGIPQEVSGKDAAMAGAANAAGAGLFGVGGAPAIAGGKRIAEAVAERLKVSPAEAEKMMSSSGVLAKTWNDGMPAVAKAWFGPSKEMISAYTNPETRAEIKDLAAGSKVDFADNLVAKIKSALNGKRSEVGTALRNEVDSSAAPVSLEPIKKGYTDHIAALEDQFKAMPNSINASKLNEAKSVYDQLFKDTPNEVPASVAFKLQEDLKDFGDLKRVAGGVNSRFSSSATQAERDLSNKAASGYAHLNDELNRVTEGASGNLKSRYKDLMDLQGNIAPALKSDQAAIQSFRNVDGGSKAAFKDAVEKLGQLSGQDFKTDMNKLQAAEYFGSDSWMPKSISGTTSTSRSIPATALGGFVGSKLGAMAGGPGGAVAGGALGMGAGNMLASPNMLKTIIENTDVARRAVGQMGKVPTYLKRAGYDEALKNLEERK